MFVWVLNKSLIINYRKEKSFTKIIKNLPMRKSGDQLIESLKTEAAAYRYSVKKMFLEILQNSQENTCARVSFLIKLQAS